MAFLCMVSLGGSALSGLEWLLQYFKFETENYLSFDNVDSRPTVICKSRVKIISHFIEKNDKYETFTVIQKAN